MAVFDPLNPLKNVQLKFTEEQISEIVDYFDEHATPALVVDDGDPTNVISIKDFIDFVDLKKFHRRQFSYPSYKEIMAEAELLQAGQTRILTIEQVLYILNTRVIEAEIKHELLLAFQVFDRESRNFLELDELRNIVTNYGDTFSENETREILRDANVRGDGNIFYENFIQSLFEMTPELQDIKVDYLYSDPDEDPSVPPLPPEPEPKPEAEPSPPPPPSAKKGKKKK